MLLSISVSITDYHYSPVKELSPPRRGRPTCSSFHQNKPGDADAILSEIHLLTLAMHTCMDVCM